MARSTLTHALALALSWVLWTEHFSWETGNWKWTPASGHETQVECQAERRATIDRSPTLTVGTYRWETSADEITSSKYDSTTKMWLPVATVFWKCLPATIDPRSKP